MYYNSQRPFITLSINYLKKKMFLGNQIKYKSIIHIFECLPKETGIVVLLNAISSLFFFSKTFQISCNKSCNTPQVNRYTKSKLLRKSSSTFFLVKIVSIKEKKSLNNYSTYCERSL